MVVEVEPLHLDHPFDYAIPDALHDQAEVCAGQRVMVGFAGRSVRGLVVEVGDDTDVPDARLRELRRRLGTHVWVRPDELDVLRWAAERFGAPLADVIRHALPARNVEVERRAEQAGWFPPGRARRLRSDPPPDDAALAQIWAPYGGAGRDLLAAVGGGGAGSYFLAPLPGEDLAARLSELAQACLAADRDVLVVVPDPGSPVAAAVLAAAGDLAVDLRAGPSPRVTYRRWLEARCGQARVVVGERSAAFFPLERLGLAVVLDEANPAHKERRSPRHHVREVVLERARRVDGVGLAVGTVPSAVAQRLLDQRRLRLVGPGRPAQRASRPRVVVDTGQGEARARLTRQALRALREATAAGAYAVVLAARRGEGRALVCAGCGERTVCPSCASSLARADRRVWCEGCGWQARGLPRCARCGHGEGVPLAAGAARLGQELARSLPAPVAVLEGYGQPAPPPPAVLVLTRGSVLDAPPGRVDAVVLPDLDGALRRPSLDAAEDTLRLAMAVAGWTVAGRRDPQQSQVVAQTREPGHHAVQALAGWLPERFWQVEAELRGPLRFPPAAHALRLRVAGEPPAVTAVAAAVRTAVPAGDDVLGPVPEAGLGPSGAGAVLLIKADDRVATLAALRPLRETWSREGVDARLDVDPVDAG